MRLVPLITQVATSSHASLTLSLSHWQTTGFTGADLANLVNEAALLAGRGNKGARARRPAARRR